MEVVGVEILDADVKTDVNVGSELLSAAAEILPNLQRAEMIEEFSASWTKRFVKKNLIFL